MDSYLGVFSKGKRIFHVNPEIAHYILDLAMAEEDMDGTGVAGRPVNNRCLRAAKRVGAIFASHQTHPCHPLIDKVGILTGAEVPAVIDATRKDIIVHRAAPPFKPRQEAGPGVLKQFELNRPTRFLLHYDCSRSDLSTADKVADLHPHEVAATELAVDREVEQRPISQAAALIEVESDLPYLLRFQRSLRARSPDMDMIASRAIRATHHPVQARLCGVARQRRRAKGRGLRPLCGGTGPNVRSG